MTRLGLAIRIVRHTIRLWTTGQVRFRLETYGLYYPAGPYAAPWWRPSPHGMRLMVRGLGSYARWIEEMERVRDEGAGAWWARQHVETMDDARH